MQGGVQQQQRNVHQQQGSGKDQGGYSLKYVLGTFFGQLFVKMRVKMGIVVLFYDF